MTRIHPGCFDDIGQKDPAQKAARLAPANPTGCEPSRPAGLLVCGLSILVYRFGPASCAYHSCVMVALSHHFFIRYAKKSKPMIKQIEVIEPNRIGKLTLPCSGRSSRPAIGLGVARSGEVAVTSGVKLGSSVDAVVGDGSDAWNSIGSRAGASKISPVMIMIS